MTLLQLTALAAPVVETTLKKMPAPLRSLASAIPVHYEALPDAELVADGFEADMLGLFTGSPHGHDYSDGHRMPAEIILFLENLWALAEDDETVFRDEVRITYLHELGHYFGWDEDDLADRELD